MKLQMKNVAEGVICNPKSIDEYKHWYLNKLMKEYHENSAVLSLNLSQIENGYVTNTTRIVHEKVFTDLITSLERVFRESEIEYQIVNKSYRLFAREPRINSNIKPFESMIEKTYRKNVLNNIKFPDAPECGWITHINCYSEIKDIVRSEISVKYLDGVDFLVNKLREYCLANSVEFTSDYEVKDVGYYAVHTYFSFKVEVMDSEFNMKSVCMKFELQISTQLQEVIKKLLHHNYEVKRISNDQDQKPWQWEYKNEQFFINYLGHTLHYLEGLILEVRDNQGKDIK